jgi:CDP-diacylglycerol--glycerol-3-phosphate 3-phosphatidyltransferase
MIDGTIARKTDSVSEFGTRLDTAADLSFILVSFLKILPRIQMPIWLWGWIFVIGVVKTGNHLWFWMHDIQSAHTAANKLTGFCLFCLPLTFPFLDLQYSAPVVCVLATFTVIRETFLRRKVLR